MDYKKLSKIADSKISDESERPKLSKKQAELLNSIFRDFSYEEGDFLPKALYISEEEFGLDWQAKARSIKKRLKNAGISWKSEFKEGRNAGLYVELRDLYPAQEVKDSEEKIA